jgi:hypothetical protein
MLTYLISVDFHSRIRFIELLAVFRAAIFGLLCICVKTAIAVVWLDKRNIFPIRRIVMYDV